VASSPAVFHPEAIEPNKAVTRADFAGYLVSQCAFTTKDTSMKINVRM